MAGQSIRILPNEFTKEQHHRVGISVPDQWDRLWTYCMFPAGTYDAGELLRDTVAADLLGTYGTSLPNVTHDVSEAAAVGSNVLKDTTENFTFDQYLRGAIGAIVEGPGYGQVFQVLRAQDNELEIALVSDSDGDAAGGQRPGWKVALTAESKYRLGFPGRVLKGWNSGVTDAGSDSISRGVIQSDLTVPASEVRYGWALQRGLGHGKAEGSNEALTTGTPVIPAAGGHLKASTLFSGTAPTNVAGTLTAIRALAKAVGIAAVGNVREDNSDTDDRLAPIHFDIRNTALSYRFPVKDEPYSRDDNGELIL